MRNSQSSLKFINYFVNKVEFYNNKDFKERSIEIDFKISNEIEYLEDDDNTFLVTLDVKIFDDYIESNYPFSMNINITGIFQIDNCDIENRENFAEINSVAILFPYLRAIVSTYTSNANIQPLILPPINIVNMLQNTNKYK